MFPIIPLLCIAGIVGGALGIAWYENLEPEKQAAADEYAAQLAHKLYDKALDELAHHQVEVIHRLVKQKFA